MGQAARRGTFEQRRKQAIQQKMDEQDAICTKRELREQQEEQALEIMVWWQKRMSVERYNRIVQRKEKNQAALASIFRMLFNGWNSFERHW